MGGGPENPIIVKGEYDDVKPIDAGVSALDLHDNPEAMVISDNDNSDIEDVAPQTEKTQLKRELKALGIDANKVRKPDYTKPLNEPSWGEDSDEEDSEYTYEEPEDEVELYEYAEIEEGELYDAEESEEGSDVEMN